MDKVSSAVANSLVEWHRMVAAKDFAALPALLHPDACFRSPMALKPYHSAQAVALILGTVVGVFDDFVYGREFVSADGINVVLEFSARVGDKELKGIDMIRFDEQGRIVDFEVMIRPFNSLQALGEEMGKRLGQVLPAYKAAKPAA